MWVAWVRPVGLAVGNAGRSAVGVTGAGRAAAAGRSNGASGVRRSFSQWATQPPKATPAAGAAQPVLVAPRPSNAWPLSVVSTPVRPLSVTSASWRSAAEAQLDGTANSEQSLATATKERLFAVVQLNGKQYKVTEADFVITARLPIPTGTTINLDKVLLVGSASWTAIGTPLVGDTAKVTAVVHDHHRGAKLQVFKKKRRKGYTRRQGHRTDYTTLRITSIKCATPTPPTQ